MDSDHGSCEYFLAHSEVVVSVGGGDPTPEKRLGSPSSSSSSSSSSSQPRSSSEQDFFQLEGNESNFYPSTLDEIASENGDAQVISDNGNDPISSALKQDPNEAPSNSGEIDLDSLRQERNSIDSKSSSRESDPGSPGSEQRSNEAHSCFEAYDPDSPRSSTSGSKLQFPPIQVMERPNDNAGTYRIPASVFAPSKFSTPADWSVASNESLFSIHVGNNSFSRDHAILFGKSGDLSDLGKLEEWLSPSMLELPDPPSPMLTMEPGNRKSSASRSDLVIDKAAAETIKAVLRETTDDKNKAKVVPVAETPHSSSHHSDGSRDSIHSFAFPILGGESVRGGHANTEPEQRIPPTHHVHSHSVRTTRVECPSLPKWSCSWCWPLPRCNCSCCS